MHGLKSTNHPGLYKLGKTYWCKITVKGASRERSLRTSSETEALKTLGRWRSEMEGAAVRAKHKSGEGTHGSMGWWLVKLRRQYRKNPMKSVKHKSFVAERVRAIAASWPGLLKRRADSILPAEIEAWRDKLLTSGLSVRTAKGNSARTVIGNMQVLSWAFALASKAGVCPVNPCDDVKMPRQKKLRFSAKHQVSKEEFDEMLAWLRGRPGFNQRAADLMELLVALGLRISEAVDLKWRAVNWNQREVSPLNAKGRIEFNTAGETKTLPFHTRLELLLKKLWGKGQPLDQRIAPAKQCKGSLSSACKHFNRPNLTQQDMRHLFAIWAIEDGVDIPVVAAWLGHRDGGALLMKTYNHFRPAHSHNQAKKLTMPGHLALN